MRIGYWRYLFAILLILALMFCGAPAGGDDEEGDEEDNAAQKAEEDANAAFAKLAGIDPKRIDDACNKAISFLKGKQAADGSWSGGAPSGENANRDAFFQEGLSALCLLALLKAGLDADDPCIKKGFDYLYNAWVGRGRKWRGSTGNYHASVLILALAARYNPHVKQAKKKKKPDITKKKGLTEVFEPDEKKQAKAFKKAPKPIRDWMQAAVNYIISIQNKAQGWAYPTAPSAEWADNSNTQYAMLALHAARTVGLKVPKNVFINVTEHFLKMQEQDGPEVKTFPVPAADFSIKRLRELQKSILDQQKAEVKRQLDEGKPPEKIDTFKTGVVAEDPYREWGIELDNIKMKARGWGYLPNGVLGDPAVTPDSIFYKVSGSMTTSGVAAMIIAKANIESSSYFKKKKNEINQSIRDGCAWLAHHFSVTTNPELDEWHMYYIYGLERAGVLSLALNLGTHNWYKEGAEYLLGQQSGDGSWPAETGHAKQYGQMWRTPAANLSNVCTTCLAVLFLKRATAAVVTIPGKPIFTGEGFLKGNK